MQLSELHDGNQVPKSSFWKSRVFKYSMVGIVIVGLLIFFYNVGAKDNEKNTANQSPTPSATLTSSTSTPGQTDASPTSTTATATSQVKTVNNVAQNFKSFSTGHCKALVPDDWTGTSNAQGTGIDLYNANKTEGAGWFIAPILTNLYGEPDTAIPNVMNQIGNSNYTFTSSGEDAGYGFTLRDFTATTSGGTNIKGKALYKKYPIDSTGYVLSYYAGMTQDNLWEQKGAAALSTAISIRCTAQYTPTQSDGFNTSTSVSDTGDKESVSDSWSEKAILGYENVYSPSTGEHYQVPTTSYSDTGLQGQDPGYYRTIDSNGSVERLETGFGSY